MADLSDFELINFGGLPTVSPSGTNHLMLDNGATTGKNTINNIVAAAQATQDNAAAIAANVTAISQLNSNLESDAARGVLFASDRGVLSNALLVDAVTAKDSINRPMRVSVSGGTSNLPSNCSWGIREVLPSATGFQMVRITGCTSAGVAAVWVNALNGGNWTGWVQL